MTADRNSVPRRGLFGAAGKATVVAGIAGGITAPFRSLGGVAWAAQSPKTLKKWVLAKNVGDDLKLTLDHFKLVEQPMPEPKQGEALIEVILTNIHSGTRNRMKAGGGTKVGETDDSNYACARVLQSRDKTYREGDIIACQAGWNTHQTVTSERTRGGPGEFALVEELNATKSRTSYVFRPVMLKQFKPDVLLDVFGTSGLTAYYGVRECGPIMPRDWIAVNGTTGSVGSMAAQICKAKGAHVVGFGGGPERAKWVTDNFGIPAIDYRAKDLDAQLKAAFPKGIDVYIDGVSGPLAESVSKQMNQDGRYFLYGEAADIYADLQPAASAASQSRDNARMFGMSDSVFKIVQDRNIKLEAWIQAVHAQDRIEAENNLSQLMNTKRLKAVNYVVKGFENAPKGVVSQYDGTNPYGKLQLQFIEL